MPIWKNIRRLASSGSVQGVKNPGVLDVVTPAQAVQILDDATWAAPPPLAAHGYAGPTSVIGVAEHSGIEFQARAGGLWIFTQELAFGADLTLGFRNDTQVTVSRTPVTEFATLGVPNGEGFESGLFSVNVATAALPVNRVLLNRGTATAMHYPIGPLFLAPGTRWFFVHFGANATFTSVFHIREVPVTDRNA